VQFGSAWYIAVDDGRHGCVVDNTLLSAEQLAQAEGARVIDMADFGQNIVARTL
jgi:hypothetical protein